MAKKAEEIAENKPQYELKNAYVHVFQVKKIKIILIIGQKSRKVLDNKAVKCKNISKTFQNHTYYRPKKSK